MKNARTYDDIFKQYANGLIADCANKLNRDLTPIEKDKFYDLGSIAFMEVVDIEISKICDADQLESYIQELPSRGNPLSGQ
ncbi:hypothetical protein [Cerasicoccus maritimus]|uniref:hypothetical protein n=1 Tax=Cerasicoccus maritimus TaxID=490089 RepID=UPI00285294AA|nr:hypothetical protein [Cerasicoccus maritimus]